MDPSIHKQVYNQKSHIGMAPFSLELKIAASAQAHKYTQAITLVHAHSHTPYGTFTFKRIIYTNKPIPNKALQ